MNLPLTIESAPRGFELTCHTGTWKVTVVEGRTWNWLNSIDTFPDGQVGPYTVEFHDPLLMTNPRFATGVQTNH